MNYEDTTVKRELIVLNEDVERLLETAIRSTSVSEDSLYAITALHDSLLDSIETSRNLSVETLGEMRASFERLENAISQGSKDVSDSISDLGGAVVGAAVVGGLFAVAAAAIVGISNYVANDPDNIWDKKVRRCLDTAKALRTGKEAVTVEALKGRLLLVGMSEHDSEYTIRASIDRNLLKQVTLEGLDALLVVNESEQGRALESENETTMSPTQRMFKSQLAGIMETLKSSFHNGCHPEIGDALNAIRAAMRAALSDEEGAAFEKIVPPLNVDTTKTRGHYSLSRESAVRLCKQLQAYILEV